LCSPVFRWPCRCHLGLRLTEYSKVNHNYSLEGNVGADGVLFGKDDTVTAYLVCSLNLLNRVQCCNDNHLLLGANCEEDYPFLKSYSNHLKEEMEQIEGKTLTT
ncbi:unnamed protein product, partial [Pocillopora meandrina]